MSFSDVSALVSVKEPKSKSLTSAGCYALNTEHFLVGFGCLDSAEFALSFLYLFARISCELIT